MKMLELGCLGGAWCRSELGRGRGGGAAVVGGLGNFFIDSRASSATGQIKV